MDEKAIVNDLGVAFEYSYLHEDWVNPLEAALDGVTAQEALWRARSDCKGIWDIVLHLAVWHENIVERIQTGNPVGPTEGHWPAPPEQADGQIWEDDKARLWEALHSVRTLLETTSLDDIVGSPYGIPDLICRFIHNGYHIGQITTMRMFRTG